MLSDRHADLRHEVRRKPDARGRAGDLPALACSGDGDAGGAEVFEGVEQCLFAEVERVVVGQGDAAHVEQGQRVDGPRRCPEVEQST